MGHCQAEAVSFLPRQDIVSRLLIWVRLPSDAKGLIALRKSEFRQPFIGLLHSRRFDRSGVSDSCLNGLCRARQIACAGLAGGGGMGDQAGVLKPRCACREAKGINRLLCGLAVADVLAIGNIAPTGSPKSLTHAGLYLVRRVVNQGD